MERRRAIAWAGSIALTGCTGVFVLGTLLGGFGLGIPRTPQTQAISPAPRLGASEAGPAPGISGAQREPEDGETGLPSDSGETELPPVTTQARRAPDSPAVRTASTRARMPTRREQIQAPDPTPRPAAPTNVSVPPSEPGSVGRPDPVLRCDVAVAGALKLASAFYLVRPMLQPILDFSKLPGGAGSRSGDAGHSFVKVPERGEEPGSRHTSSDDPDLPSNSRKPPEAGTSAPQDGAPTTAAADPEVPGHGNDD